MAVPIRPNQKKKKKSKKGWIITLSIILAVGVGVAAFFIIKHQIEINKKIETPTGLCVQRVSTNQLIVLVDEHPRAEKYEFKIIANGSTIPSTVVSNAPSYDITAICNIPNSYTITCRYLGLTEKAHSEFCESCTARTERKLITPTIIKIEEKKLYFSFNETLRSEVSYSLQLIYQAKLSGTPEFLTTYMSITDDHNSAITGYFDLSDLTEKEYSVSLRAITEEEYYISSDICPQQTYNNPDFE